MIEFILLRPGQVTREVLDILNILTETKKLSLGEARNIITLQLRGKNHHMTYVGYLDGEPICIGSIIVLTKLGRNGGRSILIEDIAVHENFQGKGYGRKLVKFLVKKAKTYKPYKILLNCKYDLEDFYTKCGFKPVGLCMRMDIE